MENEFDGWKQFSMVKVVCSKQIKLFSFQCLSNMNQYKLIDFLNNEFHVSDYTRLVFVTNTIKFELKNNDIHSYAKYLVIVPSSDKSSTSSHYLEMVTDKELIDNYVVLPMCSFNGNFLLKYKCPLPHEFNIHDVCYTLSNFFDINSSEIKIASYLGEEVEDLMPLDLLFSKRIYIAANLNKKMLDMVRFRSNILAELQDKEFGYFRAIKFCKEELIPFLEETKTISEDSSDIALSFFATTNIDHQEFIDDLTKAGSSFLSCVGEIFLRLLEKFSSYEAYISIFNRIFTQVSKRKNDTAFYQEYQKLHGIEEFPNLAISSILIKPIQKAPHYRTMIERLLKATPIGHPDYMALSMALENINEIRRRQDFMKAVQEGSDKMKEELGESVNLPISWKDQGYIKGYKINFGYYDKNLKVKFSPGIIIHTTKNVYIVDSAYKLKFDPFEYVDLHCSQFSDLCLKLNHPMLQKPLLVEFKDQKFLAEFMEIQVNTAVYRGNINSKDEPGLQWEAKMPGPKRLQRHCMASIGENIYVFGGRDEMGVPSSLLLRYSPRTDSWVVTKTILAARNDAACCSVPLLKRFYIYGGVSKEGDLRDFYYYDEDNGFVELPGFPEIGGAGLALALAANDRDLVLNGDGRTFCFNMETELWCELKGAGGPSLRGHSLARADKRLLMLLGADSTSGTATAGVWELVADRWGPADTMGTDPTPRVGQCVVEAKSHLWVFGGIGGNTSFFMTPVRQSVVCEMKGAPRVLVYSAASAVEGRNAVLYVYGGRTKEGISNAFYKISFIRTERIEMGILQLYSG